MRLHYPSIIGIGLGGTSVSPAPNPFADLYARARDAGLRLTNHSGETTGPEAIWEALSIGSERIGHAFSAIQDSALLQNLKHREVPIELNPTSNVRTGVCPSFAAHPLRRYFDLGLLASHHQLRRPSLFRLRSFANEYLLGPHRTRLFPR